MPIHFIDNYPKNDLESKICKNDRTPLYGEIWLYRELMKFNEYDLLKNETWYVKHSYNLSKHPSSDRKVEGEIDYLILNKYGLLIVEVKGGGIEVDENDTYYCYNKKDSTIRYESQNPFNQAKEYLHSLKSLIDSKPFIYRAVIFPHESGFYLRGPQLVGYEYLFFSKRDLEKVSDGKPQTEIFFNFLLNLSKESRKNVLKELDSTINNLKLNEKIWQKFPELSRKEIDRLKSELFPIQTTHGFNPDKIRDEIILEENFEILRGLRKNRKVMIQGAPGTGKTVLATKFIAENIIKQQKGIFYCANKLLRSKMEHLAYNIYSFDKNFISFNIYSEKLSSINIDEDIDYIIIDEAQEFFDKNLFDFIQELEIKLKKPKFLILFDPEQTIMQDYKEIDWYSEYFIQDSFVHYFFDTIWRCAQKPEIGNIANLLKYGNYKKLEKDFFKHLQEVEKVVDKIKVLKDIIDINLTEKRKRIILIESTIFEQVKEIAIDYFAKELEELVDTNINIINQKIHYTTPIKYRGLEAECVTLITSGLNEKNKIQNYIGATRAIYYLKLIVWK